MGADFTERLVSLPSFYIPFLFALCFHEYAHGWVAKKKGDNTAELMGRLNMNPLSHVDWVGTVGLPIMAYLFSIPFLFGWAKPVPVNPRNLRKPKEDMFWIAFAGPLSNILLFFVGCGLAFLLNRSGIFSSVVSMDTQIALNKMLLTFLFINMILAVFNLIPLHPLDGGKILARFLPYEWNRFLEEHAVHGQMILLMLIITGIFSILIWPFDLITRIAWFLVGGPLD